MQKHLFKPFYSTKGPAGTGLGLYIVRELVTKNGGTIQVASQAGKGSRFTLEFPLSL